MCRLFDHIHFRFYICQVLLSNAKPDWRAIIFMWNLLWSLEVIQIIFWIKSPSNIWRSPSNGGAKCWHFNVAWFSDKYPDLVEQNSKLLPKQPFGSVTVTLEIIFTRSLSCLRKPAVEQVWKSGVNYKNQTFSEKSVGTVTQRPPNN